MQDRRESVRDKVFLGGVAEINDARLDDGLRRAQFQRDPAPASSSIPPPGFPNEINLTIAQRDRLTSPG